MIDLPPQDPPPQTSVPGSDKSPAEQRSFSVPLAKGDGGSADGRVGHVQVEINLAPRGLGADHDRDPAGRRALPASAGSAAGAPPATPGLPRRARWACPQVQLRPAGQAIASAAETWYEKASRGASAASAWMSRPHLVIGKHQVTFEEAFFGLALAVYLCTRLIGLLNFPIYFFTDEAVQTVLAEDFVRDDFHNYDRDFFPTYFVNGNQYNLSLSVYLQVIPYLVFGKSVAVTRGTSVFVTLLGAAAMGLILRDFFKARYWWVGTMFLSIAPAWFLVFAHRV